MGKVVASATNKDVIDASSRVQMCGRKSGSEVAIRAMRKMFEKKDTCSSFGGCSQHLQ